MISSVGDLQLSVGKLQLPDSSPPHRRRGLRDQGQETIGVQNVDFARKFP